MESSVGSNVKLSSSSKISQLLGGIKKCKEQPSENIYVRYHHTDDQPECSYRISHRFSENVPSTVEVLSDRVQRLEQMVMDVQAKASHQEESKFQHTRTHWSKSELYTPSVEITSSKLTSIASSKNLFHTCPICLLTFCICRKPMKDFEQQCDLVMEQPLLSPTGACIREWASTDITHSQSGPRYVRTMKDVEVVYVP